MDLSEIELRARLAANQRLVELLSEYARSDPRIKRIIKLLSGVSIQGPLMSSCAKEIFEICAQNERRKFGFHPRLRMLVEDMSKACDLRLECSKRIRLYLDHLRDNGSQLPESTRLLVDVSSRSPRPRSLFLTDKYKKNSVICGRTGRLDQKNLSRGPFSLH